MFAGCVDPLGTNDDDEASEPDPPVEAFELSVIDVREPESGLTSATVPLVFEVENTHDELTLPSPTLDYAVFVGEQEVLSARTDRPELGPGDSSRETVELILDYGELGSVIVDAVLNESFAVEIRGEVLSEGVSSSFTDRYEY